MQPIGTAAGYRLNRQNLVEIQVGWNELMVLTGGMNRKINVYKKAEIQL